VSQILPCIGTSRNTPTAVTPVPGLALGHSALLQGSVFCHRSLPGAGCHPFVHCDLPQGTKDSGGESGVGTLPCWPAHAMPDTGAGREAALARVEDAGDN
jgi:hypothetical protein